MYQIWDKLFKLVSDYYPQDIINFIFPDKKIQIGQKYEQEKIILQYNICDINHWIIDDDGREKLLNIEPYSQWSNNIPLYVFTRNAILTKSLKFKYEVLSAVILLSKEKHIQHYATHLGHNIINCFEFPVVTFSNDDEILKYYKSLAPFLLKLDSKYMPEISEIIKDDPILKYMTVLILNHLGYKIEEAIQMTGIQLQEFSKAILSIPIMQEVIKPLEKKWELEAEKNKQEAKKRQQEAKKREQELLKKWKSESKKREQEALQNMYYFFREAMEMKFGKQGILFYAKRIKKITDQSILMDIFNSIKASDSIEEIEQFIDSL